MSLATRIAETHQSKAAIAQVPADVTDPSARADATICLYCREPGCERTDFRGPVTEPAS